MARESSPSMHRVRENARRRSTALRVANHLKQRNLELPASDDPVLRDVCEKYGVGVAPSDAVVNEKDGSTSRTFPLSGDSFDRHMINNLRKEQGIKVKENPDKTITITLARGEAERQREERINKHIRQRSRFSPGDTNGVQQTDEQIQERNLDDAVVSEMTQYLLGEE